MTRILRFVIHNWPLKLAAIILSTLLYAGLVLSSTSRQFPGRVPIEPLNQPADVEILSDLGAVTEITYVAPEDLGLRVDSASFRATVDLAGVNPSGSSVAKVLNVRVVAIDQRVQVLDYQPLTIVVRLDRVTRQVVPVQAVLGTVPAGLEVGDPVLDVTSATVTGPESLVSRVATAQAPIEIDSSGIDVNRMVDLVPVDAGGEQVLGVDVEPAAVQVKVAVFTNRRTRTVPVNPVVVGTPAAGFEIASVAANPLVVSVEGNANALSGLATADTTPISISGASSDVTQTVALALPDGVQALGGASVSVTVHLRAVTGTRSFDAGLILVGASADRVYNLSTNQVLVTIGGPVADLDRLAGATILLSLDVSGLDDGSYKITPSANLTTGLSLLGVSPSPITVTISSPASSPAPTPSP